jgi:hypothetical protein
MNLNLTLEVSCHAHRAGLAEKADRAFYMSHTILN